MKTLFNRVFDGSDEMFAKAEEEVNKIVAEVGRDAPLTLPSTAYFCACIYAYIGKRSPRPASCRMLWPTSRP